MSKPTESICPSPDKSIGTAPGAAVACAKGVHISWLLSDSEALSDIRRPQSLESEDTLVPAGMGWIVSTQPSPLVSKPTVSSLPSPVVSNPTVSTFPSPLVSKPTESICPSPEISSGTAPGAAVALDSGGVGSPSSAVPYGISMAVDVAAETLNPSGMGWIVSTQPSPLVSKPTVSSLPSPVVSNPTVSTFPSPLVSKPTESICPSPEISSGTVP